MSPCVKRCLGRLYTAACLLLPERWIMLRCIRTSCLSQRSNVKGSVYRPKPRYRTILTAIVFSRGCQLACKIFLLKSSVSVCIASRSPPGRGPFLSPFFPGGTPIFLALKADLSACNTTSFDESVSNMRKKLWYDPVSTCLH